MNSITSQQIKNKMRSFERLGVFFSHKFNNILTTMIYSAQLAASDIDPESYAAIDIGRVIDTGMSGSNFLKHHFLYINPGKAGFKTIELVAFLSKLIEKHNKTAGIRLLRDFCCRDAEVYCNADPSQLKIIINELIANAKNAMLGTNNKITLRLADTDKTFTDFFPGYRKKDYINIAVIDNGCGIPDTIINDIFDPLFTTGDPGQNSGTGLTTVYGMVNNLNGEIAVISTKRMTIFNVYLPVGRYPINEIT